MLPPFESFHHDLSILAGGAAVQRRARPVARGAPRAATLFPLGVWRSLVARSVRVGEVPSSNLGTPISTRAFNPRTLPKRRSSQRYRRSVIRAVLFDVDFTLFRPGPELGPEGYRRVGERHGLDLDPDRYVEARTHAIETLQGNRELVHDEEVWIAFTEQIVIGMGGGSAEARACAIDMVREWERHENFSLYEDALPVLDELRHHGLRIGLVSNGQRDLDEFAFHHGLDVDVAVGSKAHGKVKPHPSIFVAALEALDVSPKRAAMVGDSFEDDIEGARSLGMRAILLDRDGRHPDVVDRVDTLFALPAALGLPPGA
jgi:HAD superfamily hydrolase (TIGR01549 family)